jgi:hypothetical protein
MLLKISAATGQNRILRKGFALARSQNGGKRMPEFAFVESDSFERNWTSFLKEMEAIDADMAAILIANRDKLAVIVNQGNRNLQARVNFNAGVLQALESLILKDAKGEK